MPIFFAVLGIGALLGYAVASGKLSSQQATSTGLGSWPPTSSFQTGLASQTALYLTNALGSAAPAVAISQYVDQAPAQYLAQLPSGTTPTIGGYQDWYWSQYIAALKQAGLAPGYGPQQGIG